MESLDQPPAELPGTPAFSSRRSFFREVPWRWSDVLIGLAPPLAARASAALISPEWSLSAPHWIWLPILLLAQTWFLGYPLVIARRRCGRLPQPPQARAYFVETLWALLALPAVFAGLIIFDSLLIPYLFGHTDIPRTPVQELARSTNRFDSITLTILAVTMVPVSEEIVIRGMLYNALRQRLPTVLAALFQAIVFGLLHPFDLINSIAVGLIGLSFAVVYEWRKTLLAPVLLHAMVNGVAMTMIAWTMAAEANAPTLGVYGEPHDGGCRVTRVLSGSAAEEAGLQIEDVVTTVDGVAVADISSMAQAIRRKRVGDRVSVDFTRGGTSLRVDAVLKKRGEPNRSSR